MPKITKNWLLRIFKLITMKKCSFFGPPCVNQWAWFIVSFVFCTHSTNANCQRSMKISTLILRN